MAAGKKNLLALLESCHYRHNYCPPPEQEVFMIEGANIGSLGNFIVFSGLPKAGKSSFLSAVLASSITGQQFYGMSVKLPEDRPVALFDTESNESDFYNNLGRIRRITGRHDLPPVFNAFSTRSMDAVSNIDLITLYIEKWKPAVIVVDGLLDLISNYNDEGQSRALVDWLKKITNDHKVLLIGVIHLGKKDNHTLGHFGSMADRYAQSVLEVVKDKERGIYTLKSKFLRSAGDFNEINLIYNGSTYERVHLGK